MSEGIMTKPCPGTCTTRPKGARQGSPGGGSTIQTSTISPTNDCGGSRASCQSGGGSYLTRLPSKRRGEIPRSMGMLRKHTTEAPPCQGSVG